MKIKTTVRYHFTPKKMAMMKEGREGKKKEREREREEGRKDKLEAVAPTCNPSYS
jgi:hypothetical protein